MQACDVNHSTARQRQEPHHVSWYPERKEGNARQACATLDAGEEGADEDSVEAYVHESSEHFEGVRVDVDGLAREIKVLYLLPHHVTRRVLVSLLMLQAFTLQTSMGSRQQRLQRLRRGLFLLLYHVGKSLELWT